MNAGVACSFPLHQKLPRRSAMYLGWSLCCRSHSSAAPKHEELSFGEPGILIGTEPHQDINAGMAIFIGSQTTPRPGSLWCKISAARRALLEKPREEQSFHTSRLHSCPR